MWATKDTSSVVIYNSGSSCYQHTKGRVFSNWKIVLSIPPLPSNIEGKIEREKERDAAAAL
jgi:hypothetical protein